MARCRGTTAPPDESSRGARWCPRCCTDRRNRWKADVRAAHHRLAGTPAFLPDEGKHYSEAWSEAHRIFHRTLLEGCGNPVLLETFDRMWTASELARRWSTDRNPGRDGAEEHRRLEEAALARDADTAAELLTHHLTLTADALRE
ncbi:FCD domain-containing protein [Nocardia sp. NPDC004654]|uniref:FCD domain-containing protein n=1 Tax=Nocardia sp. NPDC004654 TaxID=3154776 RepID=UPI0033BA1E57